jgi:hypothetical protein
VYCYILHHNMFRSYLDHHQVIHRSYIQSCRLLNFSLVITYCRAYVATIRDGVWIINWIYCTRTLKYDTTESLRTFPVLQLTTISQQLCSHCNHSSGITCQHYPGNCGTQLPTPESRLYHWGPRYIAFGHCLWHC